MALVSMWQIIRISAATSATINGLLQPKMCHLELIKAVASIDLGRTLLETNASLLLPPKYHGQMKNSNPFMVADMAAEIGIIYHMLTEAVLSTTH